MFSRHLFCDNPIPHSNLPLSTNVASSQQMTSRFFMEKRSNEEQVKPDMIVWKTCIPYQTRPTFAGVSYCILADSLPVYEEVLSARWFPWMSLSLRPKKTCLFLTLKLFFPLYQILHHTLTKKRKDICEKANANINVL